MINTDNSKIKVALDVGTSKVRIVIGAIQLNGHIDIIAHGEAPSKGLRKGVVVNIEQTISAIKIAKTYAEVNSDLEINTVSAVVSGHQIMTYNSNGVIKIAGDAVSENDISEVMEIATAIALPQNQEVVHAFSKEYILDNQSDIVDPINLSGVRLDAHVYLIACKKANITNLTKCIEALNVDTDYLAIQPISAAAAVLSEEEKELGVCVINIGAGTTDIAIFHKGSLRYTSIIPIAGETVTSDISQMQRISTPLAENIKINYGTCIQRASHQDEMIALPQANGGNRLLSQAELAKIIGARYAEIFEMVQTEIERSGYNHLLASIVMTGGGCLIEGLSDFAENIFHLDTTIGIPNITQHMSYKDSSILLKPEYATVLGLFMDIQKDDFHARKKIDPPRSLFSKLKMISKKYF